MKLVQPSALIVNPKDNVATSLRTLKSGETVAMMIGAKTVSIKLRDGIVPGHKFSIADIKRGERIIKFGEVIGAASAHIEVGAHVHVHNVTSLHGRVEPTAEGHATEKSSR